MLPIAFTLNTFVSLAVEMSSSFELINIVPALFTKAPKLPSSLLNFFTF